MRALLVAVSVLGLVACGPTTTATDEPVAEAPTPQTAEEATAQDTCGAAQYAGMIGSNIAAVTFPAESGIRIIQPDSIVTEDFRPERLNVIVDANGAITALQCY
ncbi:MAG: hypothetical protein A4S17_04740 [Proteobacteria bacterium HN_bin10]|nr:MAG: hypothetical protein A4S17_04740 [Proteobacteria bacterium HN_bin10]